MQERKIQKYRKCTRKNTGPRVRTQFQFLQLSTEIVANLSFFFIFKAKKSSQVIFKVLSSLTL